MKFSYQLLKRLAPAVTSKSDLAYKLMMQLFEVESFEGDTMDVKVLSNRYGDAASHWGLAREISAFYGKKWSEPKEKETKPKSSPRIRVEIKDLQCRRAAAWYFSDVKVTPSPKWMQDVLISCGLRPINNLVDITNYVMLETGEPLHAFDAEKMDGGVLIVRRAKKNELLETLDGKKFTLDESILVLADSKDALDIAGIKGGKKAEVTKNTRQILLTACNFDGVSIYKTSRKINLITDAATRFSHHLPPGLVGVGIKRAAQLISEYCNGKPGALVDVGNTKNKKRIIPLDIERINAILGTNIPRKHIEKYLTLLGFKISGARVEVPWYRTDIDSLEDLSEEVLRMHGVEKVPFTPLSITLKPKDNEHELVDFKERARDFFTTHGFDEVYNYSFVKEADLNMGESEGYKLKNPMSQEFTHLRTTLEPHLRKNAEDNLRFFENVKVFEIGKTYHKGGREGKEVTRLGVTIAKTKGETFREIKGAVEKFLETTRIKSFDLVKREGLNGLLVEAGGKKIGYIKHIKPELSLAELNLDLLLSLQKNDLKFKAFEKYPSVVRDISVKTNTSQEVGEIIKEMKQVSKMTIKKIDLIDEYKGKDWNNEQALTFRVTFQHPEKTLTTKEVDEVVQEITKLLKEKFFIEAR